MGRHQGCCGFRTDQDCRTFREESRSGSRDLRPLPIYPTPALILSVDWQDGEQGVLARTCVGVVEVHHTFVRQVSSLRPPTSYRRS